MRTGTSWGRRGSPRCPRRADPTPPIRRHPSVRGYPSGTAPDSPVGHGTGTGQRGNGEPLLFGLGQYFVDAGLIFCQADTPGQVGLSAAELAWPGNPRHAAHARIGRDVRHAAGWAGHRPCERDGRASDPYHLIRRDLQAYPLPANSPADLLKHCSLMRSKRR